MRFFVFLNQPKDVLLHFVHISCSFIKFFFSGILIHYRFKKELSFSMKILSSGNFNLYNVQYSNSVPKMALNRTNLCDTVSFRGEKQFKYANSWYLKNETILEQDEFSTTIEDREAKTGILDKFLKKTHPKKIYDLPLRLREDLAGHGIDTVVLHTPQDLLDKTGLSDEQFMKEINKINALIALVYPRYDSFEDKTKQNFKMQMGNSVANVTRLTQGMSGIIYKIEVEGCKPLALKHYLNPKSVNLSEGAFPEIAMAKKMNEANVSDIPLLYCANPYEGWMLSEFIDKDYKTRKGGISVADYAKNNNLVFRDANSGMTVSGKDGLILVDFGYISSASSHTHMSGFDKTVAGDNRKRANSDEYINSKTASLLGKTENVNLYASPDSRKEFINEHKNDPEFKLFNDILAGTRFALASEEMPEKLKKSLQENFEKAGFIGDAVELVKSCNQ